MARGIIYCMTTVVPGLIKIGKTGINNFEQRMYSLEKNGYSQVVGLKRKFAIEVDDYDEKEVLLHDIFSKSNVPNTELFALDIDFVIQLLSSLEGKQVYPEIKTKEQVFDEATKEREVKSDWGRIPDGDYYLTEKRKDFGTIKAIMRVSDGTFKVLKGAICRPTVEGKWAPEARREAPIKDNILQADVVCNSPSTAGWIAMGRAGNGWKLWKTKDGFPIEIYRNNPSK